MINADAITVKSETAEVGGGPAQTSRRVERVLVERDSSSARFYKRAKTDLGAIIAAVECQVQKIDSLTTNR